MGKSRLLPTCIESAGTRSKACCSCVEFVLGTADDPGESLTFYVSGSGENDLYNIIRTFVEPKLIIVNCDARNARNARRRWRRVNRSRVYVIILYYYVYAVVCCVYYYTFTGNKIGGSGGEGACGVYILVVLAGRFRVRAAGRRRRARATEEMENERESKQKARLPAHPLSALHRQT